MDELFNNIDFSTKGKALNQFSDEEIRNILTDYYINNLKLSEIKEKYEIDITANKIKSHFPKLSSAVECTNCGFIDKISFPSKVEFDKLIEQDQVGCILKDNSPCSQCRHKNFGDCYCTDCNIMHREMIHQAYNLTGKKLDRSLTLRERLYLATILQGLNINNGELDILSSDEYENIPLMFFKEGYPSDEINYLRENKIIRVSERSPLKAFLLNGEIKKSKFPNENFPNIFYKDMVYFSLEIIQNSFSNSKDWFEEIKFLKNVDFNQKDIDELWKDLVVKELEKLFEAEFTKTKFSFVDPFEEISKLDSAKEKIRTEIINLLEIYPPSQVYCVLYKGIEKALKHKTVYGMSHYRDDHVQFVISYGIRSWLKYNSDKIYDYDFPWKSDISIITRLFFDYIVKNDRWFYTEIPKKEDTINYGYLDDFISQCSVEELRILNKKISEILNESL